MADRETNTAPKALEVLRQRARHIHNRCEDWGSKQAIGEMLAVLEKMPEWDTVAAALAAPAAQGATQEPVAWARPEDLEDDGYGHTFSVTSSEPGTGPKRVPLYAAPVGQAEDAARWQPIETAPKREPDPLGGDRAIYLLGFVPEDEASETDPASQIRIIWWEPALVDGGGWWGDLDIEHKPTHWMPLPPPPSAQQAGQAETGEPT